MHDMLRLAATYAIKKRNERLFYLGSVAIRNDGRIVHSQNSAVLDTLKRDIKDADQERGVFQIYKRFPESHAEVRLSKKMGFGATVFVARVARGDGSLAMAKPCECCQGVLKAFRAKKVFYTISEEEWGIWYPGKNTWVEYLKS